MDTHLARMLGASFVVGEPDALARLRNNPSVLAQARAQVAGSEYGSLSLAAREWLATGERGGSCNAMFAHFTGIGVKSAVTPVDTSDFRRCRLLIEQVPEFKALLPTMKDVSPAWETLVERWEELCSVMDAESPAWRTGEGEARETYTLMQSILA